MHFFISSCDVNMISRLLMTRTFVLPVGLFFIIAGSLGIDASICSKWELDHDSENNTDSSIVLWEKTDCPLIDCALLCGMDPSCRSYFHHPSLEKCLGSQSYKRSLPGSQAVQEGWKYYTHPQHCDLDYIYNKTLGLCYKYYMTQMNYWDAMERCEKEGAKLLIIRNEAEFQHFCPLLSDQPVAAWLGAMISLRETDVDPVLKWWNGQAASLTKWFSGQPVSNNGDAYCLYSSGLNVECGYGSSPCNHIAYFVCQKHI